MINLKTVLILGAGASKDFGFPTGRELVKKVCEQSGDLNIELGLFEEIVGEQDQKIVNRFCLALKQADPPSVDAWLEHNPEFISPGKIAIAMVLLAHERHSDLRPINNWYQLLFDRLSTSFDEFQNNRIAIVTFNYDRSLEQYFFGRFRYTHTQRSEKECSEKLNQLKILHVYGSLGRLTWQIDDPENPTPQVPYGANPEKNTIIAAANSIEIMTGSSSSFRTRLLRFQDFMKDCTALYFLGFGYHDANMQRLGIETLNKPFKVMGTAKGLSYQRIREIERLHIRDLHMPEGLFDKSVCDFLHKCVDFNEGGYPGNLAYGD